jgi:hypothetical protein
MRKATLVRTDKSDAGTFGVLTTDSGFHCFTGELPWRDNESGRSCVPPGVYQCTWGYSKRHGFCYHVQGVPSRTAIEIHSANWCGDAMKGFKCQLEGCIAPGTEIGDLDGQKAVKDSVRALEFLVRDLAREPFELTIQDGTQLPPYDFA